jgi:hypothetical protein
MASAALRAAPMPGGAAKLTSKLIEEKDDAKEQAKNERRTAYIVISWIIQISCGLLCFTLVLWAAIQFLRVFNLIGVGDIPPGIEHAPVDL